MTNQKAVTQGENGQVIKTKRKPTGAAAMGPGPGRPPGSRNKTTVLLKEAIIEAAQLVGQDGQGAQGLTGYLITLAKDEPKAFAALLGRVLPLQVVGDPDAPIVTRIELVPMIVNENSPN